MCYVLRQQQAEAEPGGKTAPPSLGRLRPRLTAAIAAALVGGLAMAALVGPSTMAPPPPSAKEAAGAPSQTAMTAATPSAGLAAQRSTPMDDGVPSNSDVAKVGAGECHHGL